MKKKLSFILVLIFVAMNGFSAPIDSKVGYKELQWGSSIASAKMAGYQLELLDKDLIDSEKKNYKGDLKIYEIKNINDKAISLLWFFYIDDKLVSVSEKLKKTEIRENKLVARYGKFSDKGIKKLSDTTYSDCEIINGYVTHETLLIQIFDDFAVTTLLDWSTYSKVNRVGLLLSGKATISDELSEIAWDLLKNTDKTKRISVAFVALTSDQKNAFVENYVTDALTQAVFETNGVKIIERKNLEKILNEQKFQSSGLVDDSSAKDIGKIAGVDYVCYGDMKDIGNEITVNARLVDVESGEVISISRTTVQKDRYLCDYVKQQAEEEKQNIIIEQKKQEEKIKRIENLAWKVNKVRNDFDGETIYSIKCLNPDGSFLFFGYEKSDNPINSRVRCSLSITVFNVYSWKDFDFKLDSGDIVKINQNKNTTFYWDNKLGYNYEKRSDSYEKVWTSDVSASKTLFNMFSENDVIYVRDRDNVHPFQTEGFLEVLAMNGISVEEIQKAFANESF